MGALQQRPLIDAMTGNGQRRPAGTALVMPRCSSMILGASMQPTAARIMVVLAAAASEVS